jgi:thiamine-phosphate pyrophosphorylase
VKAFDPSLYVLTDNRLSRGRDDETVVLRALAGGATMIQYRDKEAPPGVRTERASALLALCRRVQATFIVNDHPEVALAAGADGVHLGQSDLGPAHARRILGEGHVIGVSVRSPQEARAARDAGADYLAASGIFPTGSKADMGEPLGLRGLRRIVEATDLPVVAIGGIAAGNAAEVVRAGAAGVAVISAVVSADDIEGACKAILVAVNEGRKGSPLPPTLPSRGEGGEGVKV